MTALHQAAQKAVEALKLADGALCQASPCMWKDCKQEQMEWLAAARESIATNLAALESALQQQPELVAQLERWGVKHVGGDPWFERMADGYWTPWHLAQEAIAAPPALQEVPREAVADKRRVAMETVYFRRSPNEPWDRLTVPAGTATQHVREELIESIVSAADGIAASPSTTQQPSVAAHALNTTPVVDHATQQEAGSGPGAMEAHRANGLAWAVSCWQAEVMNRPLVNVHRRTLDDTWRQVIRYFGGDPEKLIGPNHDTLHMRAQEERAWKP